MSWWGAIGVLLVVSVIVDMVIGWRRWSVCDACGRRRDLDL